MKKLLFAVLSVVACSAAYAQQWEVSIVDVTTNAIVYDAATNRIYATIPSGNGSNGNSIGVINPQTHTLENTVFVGSDPTVMAITDNGQYIYTGFANSAAIRKFDVASLTTGALYPLGSDPFHGPYYAADIEAVPGQPDAVAVSRKYLTTMPEFAGVAIYDNGVMRPNVATRTNSDINNRIEFQSSGIMFGYNHESTGFDFNIFSVNANGLTRVANYGNLPGNSFSFYLDFITNGNFVYFSEGTVLDVSGTPFVIGQFSGVNGPAAYDAQNNAVCYASNINGAVTFKRFNANTFLLNASQGINNVYGQPKCLITCGPGYYAFNTNDNKVVILHDTTAGTNGIVKNGISLYPNPASDFIKIETGGTDIEKAIVYGMGGNIVFEGKPEENMINTSNFAAGLYLVQVTDSNNNIYTKKIVRQ
ncbi:T9SS type A sorting domain-containing protein [uncultured Flavobacterium sp.]|uniref:T9SS type A sorting domain-containing protein n=1 Tax=uncultured Flavobacterium sp. TaxID=165435 RepID=UPI0025E1A084|nr:T9SS type A sorting domain-containing protein [uncultured Flavobacterium sp.]